MRHARRRGGTYTLFVLVLSAILVGTASSLIDPARKGLDLAALRERQAVAREAALSALDWAQAAAAEAPAVVHGQGKLKLARAQVVASFDRSNDGLRLEATATVGGRQDTVTVHVRGVAKDGRLVEVHILPR